MLSLGAAAIHFAMAPEHFSEYSLYGVFFVAIGWVQVALAGAVLFVPPRSSRPVLFVGVTVQIAVMVLWAVTRIWGLPVGPKHWTAEPVAAVDALCTGFEVAAVLGFAALLAVAVRPRRVPTRAGVALVGASGVLVLALTTFATSPAAVGGGDGGAVAGSMRGMDMGGMAQSDGGGRASNAAAPGASAPVGYGSAIVIDGMSMPTLGGTGLLAGAAVPGCMMRSRQQPGHRVAACTAGPVTRSQRAAAESLVVRTRAALVNLPTLGAAYAAGYRDANITGPVYHVVNYRYLTDGRVLDSDAIESLVYYRAPTGGSMLLGAMYVADPGTREQLVGGALTPWHIHTDLCVNPTDGTAFNPTPAGRCAAGSSVQPTPPMLHVWSVAYPGGPFAEFDARSSMIAIRAAITTRGGFPTGD